MSCLGQTSIIASDTTLASMFCCFKHLATKSWYKLTSDPIVQVEQKGNLSEQRATSNLHRNRRSGRKDNQLFGGLELYLLSVATIRLFSAPPHASGRQIRCRSEDRLAAVVRSLPTTLSWGLISSETSYQGECVCSSRRPHASLPLHRFAHCSKSLNV